MDWGLNFSLYQFKIAIIGQAKIRIHAGSQRISNITPVNLNVYTLVCVLKKA